MLIILIPSALDADGMGRNNRLQFNLSVEEPFTADNLELEGAFKVRGEVERGGANGDNDAIDHIIVLIYQLERTTVAWRVERQLIPIYIYGRRDEGRFWIMVSRFCRINSTNLQRDWALSQYSLNTCGHRKDAQKEK